MAILSLDCRGEIVLAYCMTIVERRKRDRLGETMNVDTSEWFVNTLEAVKDNLMRYTNANVCENERQLAESRKTCLTEPA